MKSLINCIIFSIFFLGCTSNKPDTVKELYSEWQGKKILFPNETDTSITNISSDTTYKYKILIYVDSIGCTSCKLQLGEWKLFKEKLDSIFMQQVPLLFIFENKDSNRISAMTNSYDIVDHVWIDKKGKMNKLNKFPPSENFHTFLINRSNHIEIIGNPIISPQIKKIYENFLLKSLNHK